jgi:sugar/nucleoside kinase (ribokinase family)
MPLVKRILVAGDLNVDLLLSGCSGPPIPGQETLARGFTMTLGGAAAICAAGLGRLGRKVKFLGAVGQDLWGTFCLQELARSGVDGSGVLKDAAQATGVTVSVSSSEDRALVTYPGAIACLTEAAFGPGVFEGFDHFHVSSFFLLSGLAPSLASLLARARAEGLTTSLDPGFDPRERWTDILSALGHCDLFLPNAVELRAITRLQDPLKALQDLANGTTRTVVKLGSAGAVTLESGVLLEMPAYPVDAQDTTGAGDSFDAGFLHAWLEGFPLRTCLAWGAAAGAIATRGAGGSSSQGDAAEIERLMRSSPR